MEMEKNGEVGVNDLSDGALAKSDLIDLVDLIVFSPYLNLNDYINNPNVNNL